MEQELDIRKELARARVAAANATPGGSGDTLDAYLEVCYCDVLLAEKCLADQDGDWEIASLTREVIKYATTLEGYDHMLNHLYSVLKRMSRCLYGHPRLRVELLQLFLTVVRRIECQNGHELGMAEDLTEEIDELQRNIELADKGRLDEIAQTGHLKKDPVEWTARWEEIIDQADKKTYEALADYPRGMGFCHAYWHERATVLRNDYGLQWRSPAVMNPGVLFD